MSNKTTQSGPNSGVKIIYEHEWLSTGMPARLTFLELPFGIAKTIVEKEADYVLALKGNHKNLHNHVQEIFKSIDPSQK